MTEFYLSTSFSITTFHRSVGTVVIEYYFPNDRDGPCSGNRPVLMGLRVCVTIASGA